MAMLASPLRAMAMLVDMSPTELPQASTVRPNTCTNAHLLNFACIGTEHQCLSLPIFTKSSPPKTQDIIKSTDACKLKPGQDRAEKLQKNQVRSLQNEAGETAEGRTVWLMPESSPRYSSMLTSSVAIVSIHMAAETNPSAAMTAEPTGKPRPRSHACKPKNSRSLCQSCQ